MIVVYTMYSSLTQGLDPKPYIRTFEAALQELQRLQQLTSGRERDLSKAVHDAELEHSRAMISVGQQADQMMNDFHALETVVSDITTATSGLSDKLERLSRQHEQTGFSKFLVDSYFSFLNTGQSTALTRMWESGVPADRRRSATVVAQLQKLSRKIGDVSNNLAAQEQIDLFAERLEKDLLNEFNNAYIAADLSAMREAADILLDFNEGKRVVKMYVNQHDLFITREKLVDMANIENEKEMWEKLADPTGSSAEFEKIVDDFVEEIRSAVQAETDIISHVFRDQVMVQRVFLERLFAQRIQQQLEIFFTTAESVSGLAYVRTLHICYSRVSGLVKSLKELYAQDDIDPDGELAMLADRSFAETFMLRVGNHQYFEAERRSLNEIIRTTLGQFQEAHAQRKLQREQGIFSRFTSNLDSAAQRDVSTGGQVEREGSSGGRMDRRRIGQIMQRAVRLERPTSGGKDKAAPTEIAPIDPKNLELDYDVVQLLLRALGEAVSRDLELAASNEITEDTYRLLDIAIGGIGLDYVNVALEDAFAMANQDARSADLSWTYLDAVRKATSIVRLLSYFVKTVISAMVNGVEEAQAQVAQRLNTYVATVEEKIVSIIRATVDLIVGRVASLLLRQKKKDYQPKEDGTTVVQETTTCVDICQALDRFYEGASEGLDGGNAVQLLSEVGYGVRDLLMTHIKKFTVSTTGGVILSQ